MKRFLVMITLSMLVSVPRTSVQAGPIMKMLEEKKAKQAAGTTPEAASTNQAVPSAVAPASNKSAFETAKLKCKQLGNKEGSDKFNSCVMTLLK